MGGEKGVAPGIFRFQLLKAMPAFHSAEIPGGFPGSRGEKLVRTTAVSRTVRPASEGFQFFQSFFIFRNRLFGAQDADPSVQLANIKRFIQNTRQHFRAVFIDESPKAILLDGKEKGFFYCYTGWPGGNAPAEIGRNHSLIIPFQGADGSEGGFFGGGFRGAFRNCAFFRRRLLGYFFRPAFRRRVFGGGTFRQGAFRRKILLPAGAQQQDC